MSDPHEMLHPDDSSGEMSDDYVRLYEYLWHPCEQPERPLDEATIFATYRSDDGEVHGDCPGCLFGWDLFGCPTDDLPPLPSNAPKLRTR